MNNMFSHIIKVPCPTCEAPIGQKCFVEGGMHKGCLLYHHSRQNAADLNERVKVNLPFNRTPKVFRQNTSFSCKKGSHSKCTGVIKANHGVKLDCSCYCHREIK
jgi:primosomal replication protein N